MEAKMGKQVSYVWNIARMAAGFVGVFTAFNTAQSLESTVVSDNVLVNTALFTLYGVFTLMAIVAPKVVSIIGPRNAMVLGAIPYVLLVFANMAPSYYTFIPAFAGVGFGAAILWTGQGIHLSRCTIKEAAQTGESTEVVSSRFNGVFWTAFQFNAAVGLIASSIIFQSVANFSKAVNYLFLGLGIFGCLGVAVLLTVQSVPSGSASGPADDSESALTANDHASTSDKSSDDGAGGAGGEASKPDISLIETLKLVGTSRAMQLLIPVIFYNGASLGFHLANFPLLYQDVADANGDVTTPRLLGKSLVGYVAATFYLVNSAASYAGGLFATRYGKRPLLVMTLVTHVGYFAAILALSTSLFGLGHETPSAFAVVFGLATVFALGDSVLESQIPALVQSPTFFPAERDRDAANSNLRMWQSLGFTAQFAVGIIKPKDVQLQALMLAPMLLLSLGAVFALDRFVRPIDTGAKGKAAKAYGRVGTGSDDEGEEVR